MYEQADIFMIYVGLSKFYTMVEFTDGSIYDSDRNGRVRSGV